MPKTETRYAIDPATAKTLDTEQLRSHFHVGGLLKDGEINVVYSHYDRLILAGVVPSKGPLTLDHMPETGTDNMLERREMGILNLAEAGEVKVAGETYQMARGEILYVGMGSGAVEFSGGGRFYVLSAPAHRACATKLIRQEDAKKIPLGSKEQANERTIYQMIHPDVVDSCQLVMGYTQLATGSVWNTMPVHTHDRRMEAYLYFDLADDEKVFHLMGEPTQTRHLVMGNEEAVISPPWSIHSGAGTAAYSFCWAMAGDNVNFTDMDMAAMGDLR